MLEKKEILLWFEMKFKALRALNDQCKLIELCEAYEDYLNNPTQGLDKIIEKGILL